MAANNAAIAKVVFTCLALDGQTRVNKVGLIFRICVPTKAIFADIACRCDQEYFSSDTKLTEQDHERAKKASGLRHYAGDYKVQDGSQSLQQLHLSSSFNRHALAQSFPLYLKYAQLASNRMVLITVRVRIGYHHKCIIKTKKLESHERLEEVFKSATSNSCVSSRAYLNGR
eukprot:scaffold10238_cov276-Chaetoceros_neogracile.AAC.4